MIFNAKVCFLFYSVSQVLRFTPFHKYSVLLRFTTYSVHKVPLYNVYQTPHSENHTPL